MSQSIFGSIAEKWPMLLLIPNSPSSISCVTSCGWVVISKTPGHQPASVDLHGQIASILAAMEAATILEERFKLQKHHEYLARTETGELDKELKRKKAPRRLCGGAFYQPT
ncbi:MAG: hypothetical protein KGI75_11265 [Rhizobiaceae bacterium]|nr:hypothetical protein [Rhizobiaceae bacterium]